MSNVLNITGLCADSSKATIEGLQTLLASLQVHYTNLRGYHWHVRGRQFFTLHSHFEKMYDAVAEQVDEVAERLLQLGATPENRYSQLLGQSKVVEQGHISDATAIVDAILADYKALIALEREVLEVAGEAGDEVSVDLMVGYLGEQEKTAWMLTAYQD